MRYLIFALALLLAWFGHAGQARAAPLSPTTGLTAMNLVGDKGVTHVQRRGRGAGRIRLRGGRGGARRGRIGRGRAGRARLGRGRAGRGRVRRGRAGPRRARAANRARGPRRARGRYRRPRANARLAGRGRNRAALRRGAGARQVARRTNRRANRRLDRRIDRRVARRNARISENRYYRRGRWYRGRPRWRGNRRLYRGRYWRPAYSGWYYWYDDAWVWAPAFGVVVATSLPYYDDYVEPSDFALAYEPWSDEWFAYCSRRYRSFEPNTGYYTAYSGRRRFCVFVG